LTKVTELLKCDHIRRNMQRCELFQFLADISCVLLTAVHTLFVFSLLDPLTETYSDKCCELWVFLLLSWKNGFAECDGWIMLMTTDCRHCGAGSGCDWVVEPHAPSSHCTLVRSSTDQHRVRQQHITWPSSTCCCCCCWCLSAWHHWCLLAQSATWHSGTEVTSSFQCLLKSLGFFRRFSRFWNLLMVLRNKQRVALA